MKKFCAIVLLLGLMASLVGCDLLSALPFDLPGSQTEAPALKQEATRDVAATEAVAEPSEDEPETEAPIPTVTVSDAFSDVVFYESYGYKTTYCYHIPQIDLDAPFVNGLNQEIFDKLYNVMMTGVYEYPGDPFIQGMNYEWGQRDNIVSLLITYYDSSSYRTYFTYNFYADGSGEVPAEELWALYGYDENSFYAVAADKMQEQFIDMYEVYVEADPSQYKYYNMFLEETGSDENMKTVRPYISEDGELCCVANIYSLVGADAYYHLVNLTGTEELDNYLNCEVNHN